MVKTKELTALVDLLDSGAVAPVEVDGQPILCVSVYETARSQAEMYLLRPGQRIPPHKHSAIDDVFVGLGGIVGEKRAQFCAGRRQPRPWPVRVPHRG